MVAGSTSAVTAALVASVTCSASEPAAAPPESVQATQLSTVPKHSSPCSARDRSGSTSSRMAMTLVADALGARRIPSAWSTRQVPTVRRSCQPMPGATGRPGGALPHDARGPLVGDADAGHRAPRRASAALRHREDGVGHPGRVELHEAGRRRVGEEGDTVFVLDGGVGPHDGGAHARRADVDDEDAAPGSAHAQGAGPKGEARPNLPGFRMPVGVERRLESSEDLEARAEGARQEAGAVQPDAVVVADGARRGPAWRR